MIGNIRCVGRILSDKYKQKLIEINKGNKYGLGKIHLGLKGKDSPFWKGDKIQYTQIHRRIRAIKPKPEFCEECDIKPPKDLANIRNHKYTLNPDDYKWLCKKCHNKMDETSVYFQRKRYLQRVKENAKKGNIGASMDTKSVGHSL
jgi:hypothetical protein